MLFATAILIGAGCTEEEGQTGPAPRSQAVPVEVVKVTSGSLAETVRGIGTLRALETVEVRPEISGRVVSIDFEEAGEVARGQVLYHLDDAEIRRQVAAREAMLEAARARLVIAQQTHRRTKSLVASGAASVEELDQANADLRASSATVQEMLAQVNVYKEQLADTTIEAPFAGRISESDVDVGDFVEIGEHLATLYRTSPLEISFTLPERFSGGVQPGQDVDILVAARRDAPFRGMVDYVSPAVNEMTRDFRVKSKIDNTGNLLKPGMFATAEVTIEMRRDRPVIPEEALASTRQGYIVFVVEDGVAHRRDVEIGLREPGRVEIRDGVSVGETIVSLGHMRLSDGADVRVKEGSDDAGPVRKQGPYEPLGEEEATTTPLELKEEQAP